MGANNGQTVFNIVGAVVNYFYPGVGTLISYAGQALFPTQLSGPQLNDLSVTVSAAGTPIPILFGRPRPFTGCVTWQTAAITIEAVDQEKIGSPVITTPHRARSFAIAICEGREGLKITRIWANNQIVYDDSLPIPSGTDLTSDEWQAYMAAKAATQDFGQYMTFYDGRDDQDPDPTMESYYGIGNVPAYRGLAYVAFNQLPLANFYDQMPNLLFEVMDAEDVVPTVLQRSPEVLFPWSSANTTDPRNCQNDHEYRAGAGVYDSVEEAFADNDHVYSQYELIGWTRTTASGGGAGAGDPNAYLSAAVSLDPEELTDLTLWYAPTNYNVRIFLGTISAATNCAARAYIGIGEYVWWGGYSDGGPAGPNPGIYWGPEDGIDVAPVPGIFTPSLYCADTSNHAYSVGEVAPPNQAYGVVTIGVRRVTRAPDNPCQPQCIDPYPLLPESSDYCVIGDLLDRNLAFTPVSGGYRQLQVYTVVGGSVTKYPLGPVIPTGSADDNQAWWEARYADALAAYAANPTMHTYIPSGMTYGVDVSYPISVSATYERSLEDHSLDMGATTVGATVAAICERAGLIDAEFDTTNLTETLDGYLLSRTAPGRDNIAPLASFSFFGAVESNGEIIFPLRAQAPSFALTSDDLAAHNSGSEQPSIIAWERTPDEELLKTARVHYHRLGANTPCEQHHTWQLTESLNIVDLSLPITMSDDKAAKIAEVVVNEARTQREKAVFSCAATDMDLIPGRVGTIETDAAGYTVLLLERTYSPPGLMEFKATLHNIDDYVSDAVGGSPPIYNATLVPIGPTELIILDIPPIRDSDEDAGYYVAVGPALTGAWKGAAVYRSDDDGASYTVQAAIGTAATRGTVAEALQDWDAHVFDASSELTVTLAAGSSSLASTTLAGLFNKANAAAISTPDSPFGDWEIIQFLNASLNSDGTYTLTGLVRGLLGTNVNAPYHSAGDAFVLLDTRIHRIVDQVSGRGRTRKFKAVSIGGSLGSAAVQEFVPNAQTLIPLQPVSLVAYLRGDDSVDAQWLRQDRHPTDLIDDTDVQMSEQIEKYRVRLLRDDLSIYEGEALTTSATIPISAGAASGDIVEVRQFSARVGYGDAATVEI